MWEDLGNGAEHKYSARPSFSKKKHCDGVLKKMNKWMSRARRYAFLYLHVARAPDTTSDDACSVIPSRHVETQHGAVCRTRARQRH